MAKKADMANHIVTTAVDLAGEKGWRALTLVDVAQAARVPMSALYRHCPTKPDLLAGFSRMIDQVALSEGLPGADESPRDRLFDLMMRRFDVLSGHRAGVKAILRDLRRDPLTALLQARQLELSMRWTLQSAGISTSGLIGRARVQALCLVYGLVLRAWEQDDLAGTRPHHESAGPAAAPSRAVAEHLRPPPRRAPGRAAGRAGSPGGAGADAALDETRAALDDNFAAVHNFLLRCGRAGVRCCFIVQPGVGP